MSGHMIPAITSLPALMVSILHNGRDREVLQRTADFLGSQSTFNVIESVIGGFERAEAWRQNLILSIIERSIVEGRISNREGLSEFLYKILRSEGSSNQSKTAVLLWRLGDDYALQLLKGFVNRQSAEENVEILRSLNSLCRDFSAV